MRTKFLNADTTVELNELKLIYNVQMHNVFNINYIIIYLYNNWLYNI